MPARATACHSSRRPQAGYRQLAAAPGASALALANTHEYYKATSNAAAYDREPHLAASLSN